MKKLLILAIAATMSMTVMAQSTKQAEAVKKKIERSDDAIADAKKQLKGATWVDRATIFTDAATAYTSELIVGVPMQQMTTADKLGQPSSVEEVTISGQVLKKYVYDKIDVYVSANETIAMWVIKEDAVADPYSQAVEALEKAAELAPELFAKETSKGTQAVTRLNNELNTTALNCYLVGNFEGAGEKFYQANQVKNVMSQTDTISLAYSAICYFEGGLYEKSQKIGEDLLSIGAEQDGMTHFYLGSCYGETGQTDKAIKTLEDGFAKYPENSSIMGGLINIYMTSNQNPEKLIELIKMAQGIDPSNASLFLVESQIWDNLGNRENAYAALDKAIEIDPTNVASFYNYAILKILSSDEKAKEAAKLDINDTQTYDAMIAEVESSRTDAIRLLEKAYELDPSDASVKDILTQMYFVCRDYNDEFAEKNNQFSQGN